MFKGSQIASCATFSVASNRYDAEDFTIIKEIVFRSDETAIPWLIYSPDTNG